VRIASHLVASFLKGDRQAAPKAGGGGWRAAPDPRAGMAVELSGGDVGDVGAVGDVGDVVVVGQGLASERLAVEEPPPPPSIGFSQAAPTGMKTCWRRGCSTSQS
jgi:hypothetical protein